MERGNGNEIIIINADLIKNEWQNPFVKFKSFEIRILILKDVFHNNSRKNFREFTIKTFKSIWGERDISYFVLDFLNNENSNNGVENIQN